MKDFDDIFKQRLEDYEMKLPSSDRDDFLTPAVGAHILVLQ